MVKIKRCLTVQPRKLSRKIRKSGDGKTLRMDPAKYHELHTVDQGSWPFAAFGNSSVCIRSYRHSWQSTFNFSGADDTWPGSPGGSPLKGRRIGLLTFRCLVAALWNTWCVMLSGPSPPPLSLTSLNSIGVVPVRWMKFRSGSNDSKDSNGRWIRLPPRILKLMKFEISFEQLSDVFSLFMFTFVKIMNSE